MRTMKLEIFPSFRKINTASHQAEGVHLITEDGEEYVFFPFGFNGDLPDEAPDGVLGTFFLVKEPYSTEIDGRGILTLAKNETEATLTILEN